MNPSPNDPYKTQPLAPITQKLAQPVQLPLAALLALAVLPALVLGALLFAWALRPPVSAAKALLPSPTLGVARAAYSAPSASLPRAVVAYDAPGGRALGALEQGRAYVVVARSGMEWAQLDVALSGGAANLVWVAAGDVPEMREAAGLADLATPVPSPTAQVVYVAAPAAPAPAPAAEPAELAPLPEPTPAYVIAPPAQAPRSVVVVAYPTPTPCSMRDLGVSLVPCNGYVR